MILKKIVRVFGYDNQRPGFIIWLQKQQSNVIPFLFIRQQQKIDVCIHKIIYTYIYIYIYRERERERERERPENHNISLRQQTPPTAWNLLYYHTQQQQQGECMFYKTSNKIQSCSIIQPFFFFFYSLYFIWRLIDDCD